MTPPTLFVMVGLPGAGKTTLAKRLEQDSTAALRLTPDEWMMPLFGWGESGNRREVVEALLWQIAARALTQLGVNVVLDYGLWGRSERDDYRARAAAAGCAGAAPLPGRAARRAVAARSRRGTGR